MRGREGSGPCTHLGGEQQFARGMELDPADVVPRSLIGHREVADLLDRVAPELDAHRVLGGGGKDVEDASAHGELTPAFDQVDAGVATQHKVGHDRVHVDLDTLVEDQRFEVGETADEGLQD